MACSLEMSAAPPPLRCAISVSTTRDRSRWLPTAASSTRSRASSEGASALSVSGGAGGCTDDLPATNAATSRTAAAPPIASRGQVMAAASARHHDRRVRSASRRGCSRAQTSRTVRLVALGHLDRRHGLKGLRQLFEPAAAFLALGQVRLRTRGVAGLPVVVHHHVFFREVGHGSNSAKRLQRAPQFLHGAEDAVLGGAGSGSARRQSPQSTAPRSGASRRPIVPGRSTRPSPPAPARRSAGWSTRASDRPPPTRRPARRRPSCRGRPGTVWCRPAGAAAAGRASSSP